ncbi:MAG: FUSC family protein, partial [Rhizobiales bacterium]|nr:FUSC family protein [Hyphomicrobiales bacterium]
MSGGWRRGIGWLAARRAQFALGLRVMTAALAALSVALALRLPLPLWAVLTAVIVTQMSVGRSIKVTTDYLIGTIGGAIYGGVIAVLFPHASELALLAVLALAVAPLAVVAAINPSFNVAPVTAIIVLLLPSMTHSSPLESAIDRVIEVAVGAFVGLAVSFAVLPSRAHNLAISAAARMLDQIAVALDELLKGLAQGLDSETLHRLQDGIGEALVGGLESGEEILLEEERIGETLAAVARRPARQRVRIVPAPEGGTRQEALAPPGAEETETGAEADTATLLDDAQALALGRLLRDAAQALDYADPAYDIEWVWDGARFVLVQARPVTARRWHTYPGLAGQGAIWSNGNTRDVVPHVMGAMDWIGWRRMVDLMLEQGYRLAGFPLLPGARRSALHCGRLYLNVSLIQWEGYDALGVAPPAMNRLLGGHHPEIALPPAGWRDRLARAGRLLRYVRKSGAQRRAGRRETAQAFADSARWRAEDLARLPDDALAARLHERLRYVRTRDGMMFLQGSSGGNLYLLLDLVDRH